MKNFNVIISILGLVLVGLILYFVIGQRSMINTPSQLNANNANTTDPAVPGYTPNPNEQVSDLDPSPQEAAAISEVEDIEQNEAELNAEADSLDELDF